MTVAELIDELKTYPQHAEIEAELAIMERPTQYEPTKIHTDFYVYLKNDMVIFDIDGIYHK